jgi:hypothetical protein
MADDGRIGFNPNRPDPYDRVVAVETPEHEALWREGITLAAARYRKARRCWFCYEPFGPSGACERKGCRSASSGFERRVLPPEGLCVDCHALTRDWYVGVLNAYVRGVDDGELIPAHWVARCPSCEKKRTVAQETLHQEALAALEHPGPDVLDRDEA